MKKDICKLLTKLFIILVIVSALIIYCEVRLRQISNSYSEKRTYLETKLDSIQVLILGSSHAYFGINPDNLELKGYNLAGVSQSLYYDEELTRKYTDRLPKLRIVLISISYFSLWYELYLNNIEGWRDYFYYHFWDIKLDKPQCFDLKQISFIDLYGTSYSQNAFRKNFKVVINDYNASENGWYGADPDIKLDTSEDAAKKIITFYNSLMHEDLLVKNEQYLETIVSELTKKKIIPVLITTPVYKSFSNLMDHGRTEVTDEFVRSICRKYHCDYFDYLKDSRFDISDFDNADHLNKKGAEKFSKIINEDIIKNINMLKDRTFY